MNSIGQIMSDCSFQPLPLNKNVEAVWMDRKFEILKRVPLFSGLTNDQLEKISRITVLRHYRRNSTVFVEGQQLSTVYFIQSGIIKITKVENNGNEQIICLLQKGEMFPHVGFFNDLSYPGMAVTVTDSKLLAISTDDFDRLLDSNPLFTKYVIKMLDKRLFYLQRRLQEVISGDVRRKVVITLLRLAEEYGVFREEGVLVSIPLTHQDFANMLGMSRESVNRVLNQLKKDQLLDINRNRILIYNLDALKSKLSPVKE